MTYSQHMAQLSQQIREERARFEDSRKEREIEILPPLSEDDLPGRHDWGAVGYPH